MTQTELNTHLSIRKRFFSSLLSMNMKQLASDLHIILGLGNESGMKKIQTNHVNCVCSEQENLIISIPWSISLRFGTWNVSCLLTSSGEWFTPTLGFLFPFRGRKRKKPALSTHVISFDICFIVTFILQVKKLKLSESSVNARKKQYKFISTPICLQSPPFSTSPGFLLSFSLYLEQRILHLTNIFCNSRNDAFTRKC